MDRRRFCSSLAIVTVVGGCIGEPSPRTITPQEGDDDNEVTLAEARYYIESRGVEVTSMVGTERDVTIKFEPGEEVAGLEAIGIIASGYARFVSDHDTAERCEIESLDEFGEATGTLHIEADWARRFNAGEVTEEEYFVQILETAETPV